MSQFGNSYANISDKSLQKMDEVVDNFKIGNISPEIDLSDFDKVKESSSMTIQNITWDDLDVFADKVVSYYEEKGEMPTGVYGIPRGGVVLAVMLSHRLNIPYLGAPCKGCIVVDDIADSGDSLIHYDRMGYDIITIMYKETSKVKPLMYYKEREADWVHFPFESDVKDTLDDANNYYSHKEQ